MGEKFLKTGIYRAQLILSFCMLIAHNQAVADIIDHINQHPEKMYAPLNCESLVRKNIKNIAKDMLEINYNLLSWDSLKIFVGTFPFYAIARMADDRMQGKFINRRRHKNVHQMSDFGHQVGVYAITFPVVLFAALTVAARDPELRQTSRSAMLGLPFVYLFSRLLKKIDSGNACLRPWCEHFSRHKRARGGLPSGHMAFYSYFAFLYGLRFGPRYAIPLGALAVFSGIALLNSNRHYASQLVAGVGLGAVYAFAVDKLITKKMSESVDISLDVDYRGKPALKFSYNF